MKQTIEVFDKMEITTVDQIEPGSMFLFPVSGNIRIPSRYRVLQTIPFTLMAGEGEPVRFETKFCTDCDSNKPFVRNIICLNLDSESIVEYFLPDDKCMIGIED